MTVLSRQQIDFFNAFGYLHLPGAITDILVEVQHAFHEVWKGLRRAHDPRKRSMFVPFIDQHPTLCALLEHPAIEGALGQLLGDDFDYVSSDGNFYAGDTHWHRDGGVHQRVGFIKTAVYLDPLTASTGALRVIPGSHLDGPFSDGVGRVLPGDPVAGWGVAQQDVPAVALETRPGDLVLFAYPLLHAAFGGSTCRRMFTINSCRRMTPEQLPILTRYIEDHACYLHESFYGRTMVETATPGRMRHLEQVLRCPNRFAEIVREKLAAQREEAAVG